MNSNANAESLDANVLRVNCIAEWLLAPVRRVKRFYVLFHMVFSLRYRAR
jgi:hypothetical protein